MRWLFEPGFFGSEPVRIAVTIGGSVAVVCAIVGVLTVIRAQSFAGHALADVATAGGSGAAFVSVSPLWGFAGAAVVGAVAMDLIGVQRVRGRDVATGIVLGAATGLAALFLYLDTSTGATTGVTQTILFGSIFTIDSSTIPVVVALGVLALAITVFEARPLLLSSMSPEIAAARGISQRLVGLLFMVALALAVGLSALAIGSILSTALLIGPAASALRLTRRIASAMVLAAAIGVGTTWLGILLAYDSFYWGSAHEALPVSFFVVALVFTCYLASGLRPLRALAGHRRVVPALGET